MKKYLLLFALAFTMTTTFAKRIIVDGTLTGYVDDAMCAAKGSCSSTNRVMCATKCIKGGEAAVLVVDGKVYKVSNQKSVVKYAGRKVVVTGKINGDVVEVTKVTLAKA